MTESAEAEQQATDKQATKPGPIAKPDPNIDRFISKEGEMTIAPPPTEKPAEEKPETLADTDHS